MSDYITQVAAKSLSADNQPGKVEQVAKKASEAYQSKQEQKEKDFAGMLPVSDFEYQTLQPYIANASDPDEASYRMATALQYSRMLGKPLHDTFQNLEIYHQEWTGQSFVPKTGFKAVTDSYRAGALTLKMGKLGRDWKASNGENTEIEKQLDDISKQLEALQDNMPRPWYTEALKMGAQSAPFTLQVMGSGLMAGTVAAGTAVASAGAAGLTIGTGGTLGAIAAPMTIGMFSQAGGTLGAFLESFRLQEGLEYYRLRKDGVDPEIAGPVSSWSGGLQAVVEVALGNVPYLMKSIGKTGAQGVVSKVLKRVGVKNVINRVGRGIYGYGRQAVEEGAEEAVQEFISIAASAISMTLQEEGVTEIDANKAALDALESFKGGFMASLVLGIPGEIIQYRGSAAEAKNLKNMASSLNEDDFIRLAGESDLEMFEGFSSEEKTESLKHIWNTQQKRKEKEEKKAQEEEVKELKKKVSTPIRRLEDGKLYTATKVATDTEKGTRAVLKSGDPATGKPYGYIDYTIEDDTIHINRFDSRQGIESEVKKEMLIDLMRENPDFPIEWDTEDKEELQLLEELKKEAPTFQDEDNIQWFKDMTPEEYEAQEKLYKQIEQWMPKLSKQQRVGASALLKARADVLGLKLDEYIDKYHVEGVFGKSKKFEAAQDKRGGVSFENIEGQAKAIIYAAENADFSTWVHENAHVFRLQLEGDLKTKAEKVFKVVDGNWTTDQEELFAVGLERYLQDGQAPNEELKSLYQKFAEWINNIYKELTGKIKISDDIREIYDSLLEKPESPIKQESKKSAEKSEVPLFQNDVDKPIPKLEDIFNEDEILTINKAREDLEKVVKTIEINTPERWALRMEKAAELYGKGSEKKEKKLFLIIGPPAAGKSTIAQPIVKKHGAIEIDADKAKELLPEYNNGAGAGAVHIESSIIAENFVYKKALEAGDNIVLPKVGKTLDKCRNIINNAKEKGYEVALILNELPPEKTARRAHERYLKTGRFVDPVYILNDVGLKPSDNFSILKVEVDNYERYSNDVEWGRPPRLIESSNQTNQERTADSRRSKQFETTRDRGRLRSNGSDRLQQNLNSENSLKKSENSLNISLFQSAIQTDSAAFKAWFGDSKVVDENGKPLVVYHGTPAPGHITFMFLEDTEGEGNEQSGPGFYFTTDPDSASGYAYIKGNGKGGVYPVYLSIKNPIEVDFMEGYGRHEAGLTKAQVKEILSLAPGIKEHDGPLSNWGDIDYEGYNKVFNSAVKAYYEAQSFATIRNDIFEGNNETFLRAVNKVTGYDGSVSKTAKGATHWIAWFPEQIKSVNNQGTWDPDNPNILYQLENEEKSNILSDEELEEIGVAYGSKEKYQKAISEALEKFKDISTASKRRRTISPGFGRLKEGKSEIPALYNFKRLNVIGKIVTNPEEAAALFSHFRNPRIEIFNILYTSKTGEVVGHTAWTSGLPGSTRAIDSENWDNTIKKIKKTKINLNAEKIWIAHNHPSGDPEPSPEDIKVTNAYGAVFQEKFGGHIVVNHNKYSHIDQTGSHLYALPVHKKRYMSDNRAITPRGTGPDITCLAFKDVFSQKNTTVMAGVDTQGRVVGWVYVPKGKPTLKEQESLIKAWGATSCIMLTNNNDDYVYYRSLRQDTEGGSDDLILAVISVNKKTGNYEDFDSSGHVNWQSARIKEGEDKGEYVKRLIENRSEQRLLFHEDIPGTIERMSLFNATKDIEEMVSLSKDWEEFKSQYEEYGEPADNDEWYKTVFNDIKLKNKPQKRETKAEVADRIFVARMQEDEEIISFLRTLWEEGIDEEPIREIAAVGIADEEEEAKYNERLKKASRILREAHPLIHASAISVGKGRELNPKTIKSIRTMISKSPTDYRILEAVTKGDYESLKQVEADIAERKEIKDPRWLKILEGGTIYDRIRLSKQIKNEQIAEKIRTGKVYLDDDSKEYLNNLAEEIKKNQKKIAKIENELKTEQATLSRKNRKIIELTDTLNKTKKQYDLAERRINNFIKKQKEIDPDDTAARNRLLKNIERIEKNIEKARTEAGEDKAKASVLLTKIEVLEKEKARQKQMRSEARALREVRETMKKLANAIVKEPAKSIDIDYADKIKEIQAALSPHFRSKKTMTRLKKSREFFDNNPEARDQLSEKVLKRIYQKPLNEWTLEELRDMYDRINELKRIGRNKRRLYETQEQRTRDRVKQMMLDDVLQGEELRKPIGGAKPTKVWDKVKIESLRPDRIVKMLGAVWEEWLLDNVNEAWNNTMRAFDKRVDYIKEKMEENKLTVDPLDIRIKTKGFTWVGKQLDIYGFEYDNGKKPTIQDAMYWYIGMNNEKTRKAILSGCMIPYDTVLAGINMLSDEQKKVADFIRKDLDNNFDRLRNTVRKLYNIDVEPQEFYVPMRRLDISYESRNDEIMIDIAGRSGMTKQYSEKGFIKSRIDINDDRQAPIRTDLVSLWYESAMKEEAFINQDQLIKRLHAMAEDLHVRRAVQQKYGSAMNKWISKYINDLAKSDIYNAMTGADRLQRTLRSHVVIAYLSFNVLSNLKQLVSVIPFLADAGPYQIMVAAGEYLNSRAAAVSKGQIINSEFMAEIEEKSPAIKHRSISREFEELKRSDGKLYNEIVNKIGKTGMISLEVIDKVSVAIGWKAVYNNAIKKGKSEIEAVKLADASVVRTQPSGRTQDLAQMYRSGDAFKWFTMFTNALNAYWNMAVFDIPQAVKNKQVLKAVGDITAIAASGAGIAIACGALVGDDDEEKKKKMMSGIFSQFTDSIPIVGNTATAIMNTGMGLKTFQGSGVQIFPAGESVRKGMSAVVNEEYDKAFEYMVEGSAYAAGLPVAGPKRVLRSIYEQYPGAIIGLREE